MAERSGLTKNPLRRLWSWPSAAARSREDDPERSTGAAQQLAADLAGRLDGLLGEVGKLGREQFRATTLLEGQGATLEELADAWREHLGQQQREVAQLRRLAADLQEHVRLRLATDLLPVVDALDASVGAARELRAELPARRLRRPSWLARLSGVRAASAAAEADWGAAVDSWLQGLLLVERRLLACLEREGVRPIPALGQPFDPHRHLAVAVRHDSGVPEGTVVAEELRGYTIGDRVLRHAEVVVARDRDHRAGTLPGGEQ